MLRIALSAPPGDIACPGPAFSLSVVFTHTAVTAYCVCAAAAMATVRQRDCRTVILVCPGQLLRGRGGLSPRRHPLPSR